MRYGIQCDSTKTWMNGWSAWWSEKPVYRYKTFKGAQKALNRILGEAWSWEDTYSIQEYICEGEEK